MRYLGNKQRLVEFIEEVIDKYNITGEVFGDLFSGTSAVGDHFKDRYKIISNDFLYFSSIISKAKLLNNTVPSFDKFKEKYKMSLFDYLNSIEPTPNGNYFLYNNYTPRGDRMFFTEENAAKIDAIRIAIEQIYLDELLKENEYVFILASLLESVTKVSNTSGTYEAFFKFWESRSLLDFILEPIEMKECKNIFDNEIYQEDTNELIRRIEGDIAYIDPPYTVTQYVSAYHMLETIAKYDYPKIKGVGGKRGRGDKNSLYARKGEVRSQFEDLFRQLNFKYVLVSYSNQGLISVEELIEIIKPFAKNEEVLIEYLHYPEYQNHRSSNKKNGGKLKEFIIIFEKDTEINKSPLNYSGSKDKIVPEIIKELPSSFSTFVDAMGGAFNVGANIATSGTVVYNDYNTHIYEIIKMLSEDDKNKICKRVESIIKEYKLEKGYKEGYYDLRKSYNKNPTPMKLFALHMYSFQNMIRFNNDLEFNTPCGVAGYSEDLKERIMNFIPKSKSVILKNEDYRELDYSSYPSDTVFYFDPPYFITSAAYNDGKRGYNGWSASDESKLLALLARLDEQGYKFLLSNVLRHKDKTHHILIEWIKEHNFSVIDMGTTGWRYTKNEVLIKNYKR